MLIVAERINTTRKRIAAAVRARDADFAVSDAFPCEIRERGGPATTGIDRRDPLESRQVI